jgi:predicted carbohydrate-binding protein with CBM5 and CBM33 domain
VRLSKRLAVGASAILMTVGLAVALNPGAAQAHGVAMFPGSRTWLCYVDGLRENGQIIANNPACAAAIAQGGTTPLYNWFAVLDSNAGGKTTGYVPDGTLCSAGDKSPYDFRAYNAARADWPVTHLTSGATYQFRYSNWARHPGTFQVYITRQGWSPTTPLAWADLTAISSFTNPPDTGGPGAFNYYFWNQQMPTGRTGRALMFIQWVRSDSNENFFSCSDINFDGGTGGVTGVGSNQTATIPFPTSAPLGSNTATPSNPPTSNPPTTSVPTTNPPTTGTVTSRPPTSNPPSTTTGAPPTGTGCTATYSVTNFWSNGFQGGVVVRNNGSASIGSWTVRLTWPSGQTVTQAWNSVHSQSGAVSSFTNATWNGSVPGGQTTSFGVLGSGSSTPVPTATCTTP